MQTLEEFQRSILPARAFEDFMKKMLRSSPTLDDFIKKMLPNVVFPKKEPPRGR